MAGARHAYRAALTAVALALVLAAAPAEARRRHRLRAGHAEFAAQAMAVGPDDALTITDYQLEGETETATLDLEPFEVWHPNATIVLQSRQGGAATVRGPPKAQYFRGKVVGSPNSAVLMSVGEDGQVTGMTFKGKSAWAMGKPRRGRPGGAEGIRSQRASPQDLNEPKPFECGNHDHDMHDHDHSGHDHGDVSPSPEDPLPNRKLKGVFDPAADRKLLQFVDDSPYDATIAIETDAEYLAQFGGNVDAATRYAADLIGYADVVYSREINTDMRIGFFRLWTGGVDSDPYPTTTVSYDALTAFKDYWNANMQSVERTTAHMLSGKATGGGVAWVGVLCGWYSSPSSNLAYGFSGSLRGTFKWNEDQTANPTTVVWDVMQVLHELGHNFNSPHSHDYCNIGGVADPVDNCYAGCSTTATSGVLPSCSAPTPHWNGGKGTLMSYCHLLSGGYNNVAMTFGVNHTCGTAPNRIAQRMRDHVVSQAARYPRCFQAQSGTPSPSPKPPPATRPPQASLSRPPPPRPPSPNPPSPATVASPKPPSPRPPSPRPPKPPSPPTPSPRPPSPSPKPPSPKPPSPKPPSPRPPSPSPSPPASESPSPSPSPTDASPSPDVCQDLWEPCRYNYECCSYRCRYGYCRRRRYE